MSLVTSESYQRAGHVALFPSRRNLGCLTLGFAEADPRQLAPSVRKTCALDHGSAAPIYIANRRSIDFERTRFKLGSLQSRLLQQLHQDLRQPHGENKKIFERVTRKSTSTKALMCSLHDRKTPVLRALATVPRSSSRRSLQWKDAKSNLKKYVKFQQIPKAESPSATPALKHSWILTKLRATTA